MRDSCPHRGIPLSCGWFDGQELTCKYHGWAFEPASGQCHAYPVAHPRRHPRSRQDLRHRLPLRGARRIRLGLHPATRLRTHPSPPSPRSAGPKSPKFGPRFRSAHLTADLPCNVDHGIIGLMDPAHGPFVHQAWWWRKQASIHEKEKHFEPIPEGFRMSAHAPSGNSAPYKLLGVYGEPITTTIDFVLPNRRYETIRCGDKWFASLTTVTPTVANACRIDVCAAWNVFYAIPFVTIDCDILRAPLRPPGPGHDDPAGRGPEVRSLAHAHRRRRPPREVVFRAQAGASRLAPDRTSRCVIPCPAPSLFAGEAKPQLAGARGCKSLRHRVESPSG